MPIARKPEGGDFTPVPAGTHTGLCIGVYDLGWQKTTWEGQEKTQYKVWLAFEVPSETIERDGKTMPMVIGATVTNSLGERAKLRRWLEAWRGRAFTREELDGFDLQNILGKPCTLTVVHNEQGKARIENVGKVMSGITVPPAAHDLLIYDIPADDNHFAGHNWDKLPEFIQRIISERVDDPNKKVAHGTSEPIGEPLDDYSDLPF